jgi:hypothetical protein
MILNHPFPVGGSKGDNILARNRSLSAAGSWHSDSCDMSQKLRDELNFTVVKRKPARRHYHGEKTL